MAFATESLVQLTPDDFLELPVEQRYALYMGIAAAAMVDLSKVSDEELHLLGYGIFQDVEAKEAVGENEWNDGFYIVRKHIAETDQAASWELSQGDYIIDEPFGIPLTAVGLVAAFYGGSAALGAAGTIGTGTSAAAGAGAGVSTAQGIVASAATPAMMLASKITGVLPTGVMATIAKVGSGVIGVTGTVGVTASIWDHIVNTDENEAARADTTAQRDAYADIMAGVDEGYTQQEMDARERYMGNAPGSMGIDGAPLEGMTSGAAGAPDPTSLSFDRPAGNGQVAPPPDVPGGQMEYDTYLQTGPPIGPGVVDPNADNPYIGNLQEGYLAHIQETVKGSGQKLDLYASPQYRDSDFQYATETLTERTIEWFQDKMVRAGYMKEDQNTGLMDTKTIDTLERVMYEANTNGKTWRNWSLDVAEAGDELAANEDASAKEARLKAIGPFQRKTYLEPDYATLATTAKNAMERELGRQINDWEMQFLVDQQEDDYRGDFDASESARLNDYQAQVRAVEDDLETGDTYGGGTVQDVDPGARFQQTFEAKFSKEIARKKKTVNAEERASTMMQGLNNAMSAIGGR